LTSLFGLTTAAALTVAIVANAFFAQPRAGRDLALGDDGETAMAPGATTRLSVEVGDSPTQTVRLRYDPVVEDVQRELLAAGYYKGTVDGIFGKRTRLAIEAYQRAAGLGVTGTPTAELAEHIRYTREIAEASLFTGSVDAQPAAGAEERARIRRLQTGLAELAYAPGPISGEINEETRAAIRQFQHDRGLAQTGEISDELLAELAKMSGQSEFMAQ